MGDRRRWSSLKNDSHSVFPLEVKPLLVGRGLRSYRGAHLLLAGYENNDKRR